MASIFVNEARLLGALPFTHFAYTSCPAMTSDSLSLDLQKQLSLDNIICMFSALSPEKKKKPKTKTTVSCFPILYYIS